MLTVRFDGKRIVISGRRAFSFAVSPANELIVEAPEGVGFSVGGQPEVAPEAPVADYLEVPPMQGSEGLFGGKEAESFDSHVEGQSSYAYLYAVLDRHGRYMTTPELTELVLSETAYRTEAGNPRNTLFTALGRKPDLFVREKAPNGDTIWGLAKWGAASHDGIRGRE